MQLQQALNAISSPAAEADSMGQRVRVELEYGSGCWLIIADGGGSPLRRHFESLSEVIYFLDDSGQKLTSVTSQSDWSPETSTVARNPARDGVRPSHGDRVMAQAQMHGEIRSYTTNLRKSAGKKMLFGVVLFIVGGAAIEVATTVFGMSTPPTGTTLQDGLFVLIGTVLSCTWIIWAGLVAWGLLQFLSTLL